MILFCPIYAAPHYILHKSSYQVQGYLEDKKNDLKKQKKQYQQYLDKIIYFILGIIVGITINKILEPHVFTQLIKLIKSPIIIAFVCSVLFFLLIRSQDVIIIFKTKTQRTERENFLIEHGLRRYLFIELFILLPASITLFRLIIFPLIRDKLLQINSNISAWYALMGVVAYGFPFATIRLILIRIALATLKKFSTSIEKEPETSNRTN